LIPLPANPGVSVGYYLSRNIINSTFLNIADKQMHCSTTTDRRIISQPRYMVVGRYQKQNTFFKSPKQNWNKSLYTYSQKAAQAFANF